MPRVAALGPPHALDDVPAARGSAWGSRRRGLMTVTVTEFLLLNVATAILVSVIATQVFTYLVQFRRPRVDLSPQLVYTVDEASGRRRFKVKVINRTRVPITDIHANLHVAYRSETGYRRLVSVPLLRANPLWLDRYHRHDRDHDYALRFTSRHYDDVLAERPDIPERHQLRFRLVCRHSVTGVVAVFTQYYEPDQVVEGDFAVGNTFQVLHGAAWP